MIGKIHETTLKAALAGSALAVFGALAPTAVSAQSFEASEIEYVIPFSPGGGADAYGRYMANLLEQNLPGNPPVIVNNVEGGGSVTGANYFDENGADDGSTVLMVSTSTSLTYALNPEDDRIRFDASQWNAFAASPLGRVVYVQSSTGASAPGDVAALEGQVLAMGLSNPTGSDMPNLLSLHLLGIDIRPIYGIDGSEQLLAFMRSEIQIDGTTIPDVLGPVGDLIDEGTAVPLFSFGIMDDNGDIQRDPVVPDVPTFLEVYEEVHGEPLTGIEYDVWLALFRMSVMNSKILVLPSSVPPSIVDVFADAMAQGIASDEYAENSGPFTAGYPQLVGAAAQASLEAATSISDESRAWLQEWLRTEYDVDI